MRREWLETGLDHAVAAVLAVFVVFMVVVLPLYRRWRWPRMSEAGLRRVAVMQRWRYGAHVALGGVLPLVPGVSAANLGLAVPPGRAWPAAVGLTGGAVAVAVVLALRQRLAAGERGEYGLDDPREHRRRVVDVSVGSVGDTVVYVVLPVLVAVGAFGLPVGPVAVVTAVGYGFAHVPHGLWTVVGWTAVTAVAVVCFLMTASALLPALLFVAVAVADLHAVPAAPQDPAPPPPLVEPPR